MITPAKSFQRVAALLAIGSVLALSVGAIAAPEISGAVTPRRMADKAAALPLKASFEKNSAAMTEGPYVLTLKNTSSQALKVSVKVNESVAVHNRPKTRELPAQEIAPGKDRKIDDLAAGDVVIVSADGFESLTLTVH